MSQQINLYEDRLRPNREPLTGRRLALAAVLVLAVLVAWGVVERRAADAATAQLAGVQAEVAASQQRLAALGKSLAERKLPDALKAQIDGARVRLASHQAVMSLLDAGQLGNETGFSAVMRGFSHLASNELWLTGFTVAAGGQEIEIRGRMFDAAKLPQYVQRLADEPAFKGLRFAALDMQRETLSKAQDGAANVSNTPGTSNKAGTAGDAESSSRIIDFVLRSENAGEVQEVPAGEKAKTTGVGQVLDVAAGMPQRISDLAQLPEGVGEALSRASVKK